MYTLPRLSPILITQGLKCMPTSYSDLCAALADSLLVCSKPLIGPLVGTTLVIGRDDSIDIRKVPLHSAIAHRLPLLALPLQKAANRMRDGRGTMFLLFYHLLRDLTDSAFSLNPDKDPQNRKELRYLFHENGLVCRVIDDTMNTMRVEASESAAHLCILEFLASRISLSLAQTFTNLVMNAPSSVNFADLITFSECFSSVERDSTMDTSCGIMFDICSRSLVVEEAGRGCILKVHRMWLGMPFDGDSSDEEDEESNMADFEALGSTSSYERFQDCMSILAGRGISLLLTSAKLPKWMVHKTIDGAKTVHLLHSLDRQDIALVVRRLGISYVTTNQDGIILIDQRDTFGYTSLKTCGHKVTSDKQYLDIQGLTGPHGDPCQFIHVRIPSVRLVVAYRDLVLSSLNLLRMIRQDGILAGGGSYLNNLGHLLGSSNSQIPQKISFTLGSALQSTAAELATSRQTRLLLKENPTYGVGIEGFNVKVIGPSELINSGIVLPYTVARDVVMNAIMLLGTILSIDEVEKIT